MNANETTQEKHPPTKLIFLHSYRDYSCDIRERLTSLPTLIQLLGYAFQFEMPTVKCVYKEKRETYTNWRGKEKERMVYDNCSYCHYLCFSKELSEEELKFWRIFKLGYLTRHCMPEICR
jgi:hypothetical protein